eukprot:3825815-Ditylum_brightwellii.AAC.1
MESKVWHWALTSDAESNEGRPSKKSRGVVQGGDRRVSSPHGGWDRGSLGAGNGAQWASSSMAAVGSKT